MDQPKVSSQTIEVLSQKAFFKKFFLLKNFLKVFVYYVSVCHLSVQNIC